MNRSLPALVAVALLPLGGCAVGETVIDPLVVISGPRAFSRFELRDADDRVIWSLAADEPAPVAELVYGEVPPGFSQEAPAGDGRPRALVVGELLTLESATPLRFFHHEGFVTGGQRLSIEYWEMKLRNPPASAELDGGPGPP